MASMEDMKSYLANLPNSHHNDLQALHALSLKWNPAAQASLRGYGRVVDRDDSGNFDPNPKKLPKPIKRYWAKRIRSDDEIEEATEKKWTAPVGVGLPVTFKFTIKPALDYLKSIPDGGNWPYNLDKSDDEPDDTALQTRRRIRPTQYKVNDENSRSDNLSLEDLTSSSEHSQRYGCKPCFLSGLDDCGLIRQPLQWPCPVCFESKTECELVIYPEFKKVCEPCKRKKLPGCSYRDDGGIKQTTCHRCDEDGDFCLAAPLDAHSNHGQRFLDNNDHRKRVKEPRIGDDGEEEHQIEHSRRYLSCNQCREKGIQCSLKIRTNTGPCKSCRDINGKCRFVLPPSRRQPTPEPEPEPEPEQKKGRRKIAQVKAKGKTEAPRKQNNEKENSKQLLIEAAKKRRRIRREDRQKEREKKYTTITTSFSHPIIFNHPSAQSCLFCATPLGIYAALFGLSPVSVTGFYLPSGAGFREVRGGLNSFPNPAPFPYQRHVERAIEVCTKMCIPCTLQRVEMASCEAHEMRELGREGGFDEREWERTVRAITMGADAEMSARFCSVCPNFAAAACCAGGDGRGCGLLLCEACVDLVQHLFGTHPFPAATGQEVLQALVRAITTNSWEFSGGVRADASFLLDSGELIQRINDDMMGSDSDGDDADFDAEERTRMVMEDDERAKDEQRSDLILEDESDDDGVIDRDDTSSVTGRMRRKRKG